MDDAGPFQYAQNIIVGSGTDDPQGRAVTKQLGNRLPQYFRETHRTLLTIMQFNFTGYGVIQRIIDLSPKQVIIIPAPLGVCNADAGMPRWKNDKKNQVMVEFTPFGWGSTCTGAGTRPDEVLLHELVHAYRMLNGTDTVADLFIPGFAYHFVEEFVAILLTNIYMCARGRSPLRKDHKSFDPLYPELSDSASFLKKIRKHAEEVRHLTQADPKLCWYVRQDVRCAFNPVKYYLEHTAEIDARLPSGVSDIDEDAIRDLLKKAGEMDQKKPKPAPGPRR